jgi:hypothetical protein
MWDQEVHEIGAAARFSVQILQNLPEDREASGSRELVLLTQPIWQNGPLSHDVGRCVQPHSVKDYGIKKTRADRLRQYDSRKVRVFQRTDRIRGIAEARVNWAFVLATEIHVVTAVDSNAIALLGQVFKPGILAEVRSRGFGILPACYVVVRLPAQHGGE